MSTLAYKVNADQILERLRSFYERRAQDRIFAVLKVPSLALHEFAKHNPEGLCSEPDPHERIKFWDGLLKERSAIEDDSIPSAYISELDQGLYGGLLGGDVQFMCNSDTGWISSMIKPLLKDWLEFDSLKFGESHPWFKKYLRQLEIFVEGSRNKFGVSHFILIDGLNFVFELIGATETYMSLLEHPGMVRKAVDFAFDLNVKIHNTFFNSVPLLSGGTCSFSGQWIPGKIISESVDPFHMTSVDDFEKWGREPVQRIFDKFDGGALHLHGNGRHLLESVCSLEGLKTIWMGDDKGFPSAFDILNELKSRAGNMPLILAADYEKFVKKLEHHKLTGGVLYEVSGVPDTDTANRCMEKIREYRL